MATLAAIGVSALTVLGFIAAAENWPTLPTSGFVSGRVAEKADFDRGDAVFLSMIDGKPVGKPAAIAIPQFAYLIEDGGKRRQVIVVQAEITPAGTILGMRDVIGSDFVALSDEVQLLGKSHP